MWQLLTVMAALVACGTAQYPGGGGFYPGAAYGGYGHYLPPPPPSFHASREAPLQLTCTAAFTAYGDGHQPYIVEAIAASIKKKGQQGGYGGLPHPALLGPYGGGGFGGPPGFGGGFGGFPGPIGGGPGGLAGQVELFSSVGGHISVLVTERAFTAEGCINDNYGLGLTSQSNSGAGGGYEGFGGPGGYGGGGGYGFAGPQQFFGGKGGSPYGPSGTQSIITKMVLEPGVPKVITLDWLQNFEHLEQLAGRGLIACADTDLNYDGSVQCSPGAILSCCSLDYDNQIRSLNVGGSYH